MIRTLLATTAIATLIATGALAQTAPAPMQSPAAAPETPMIIRAEGALASNIIGKAVYNGTGDDAENIGSVSDLVISPDGSVEAIVVGVGGFLGLGQKMVALQYDLVEWTERDNDRYLVVETTADALRALQDFDRSAYQPMPADAQVTETSPATREELDAAKAQAEQEKAAEDQAAQAPAEQPPADNTAVVPAPVAPAPADNTAQAPAAEQAPAAGTDPTETAAIDRSTLTEVPMAEIRSEDLVGTTVYGANDERIGEVGDIILSNEQMDAVVLDVGGFLGIGEKEVAVGMDNLAFMRDDDGDYYLYTEFTKEQLEAQPAYDEGGYEANRDTMRMTVPPQ